MNEAPPGVILSDDLFFASKVTATARVLGLPVQMARTAEQLLSLVAQHGSRGVLLDLHVTGDSVADVVRRLKAEPSQPHVVGYGSHVDTETLQRARDAGCDLVLPRSKFTEALPHALAAWMNPEAVKHAP